jgi:hypothetical protein
MQVRELVNDPEILRTVGEYGAIRIRVLLAGSLEAAIPVAVVAQTAYSAPVSGVSRGAAPPRRVIRPPAQ